MDKFYIYLMSLFVTTWSSGGLVMVCDYGGEVLVLQPYFICFNCSLQIYIVLTNNMTNDKMSWLVQLCTTQLVFKTSIKLATLKLTYSKWHFWSNDNCSRWVLLEWFSQSISSWFFILAFNIEDWKFILFGIIAIIDTE